MITKFNDGILTIEIDGRIDSANAQQIADEINQILSNYNDFKLVLDIDNLEYISSAGLRVVLALRKKYADIQLVNASSEVYDIFDMTGMAEMINISKKFRKVSVDGCEVIGQGANGVVYRIDADTIVKVYINPDSLPDIQRERELARKAFVLGIPTAMSYDVVKVGDSYGSVFELLNAKSFSKLFVQDPDNFDFYVQQYVNIMNLMHKTKVKPDDMPNMKGVVVEWAEFTAKYLSSDESEKLLKLVNDIPERDTMIHGDYHTNNIMLQNGEALLIDMDTICYGHPIFELASMFMGFVGFGELDHSITQNFMKMPYELAGKIWRSALAKYLNTSDKSVVDEVERKAMVIGYTRLMRRTIRRNGFNTEDGVKVIESCRKHLSELLPIVDTLDF